MRSYCFCREQKKKKKNRGDKIMPNKWTCVLG